MARKKDAPESLNDRLANRIDQLSRLTRILINIAISLLIMAVVGLPIVFLSAGNVNEIDTGEILYVPTTLVAVVWIVIYAIGWWALVGFDWNPEEPWRAKTPAVVMVSIGILALFLVILEIIFGLLFAFVL